MTLREWLETDDHRHNCVAWNETCFCDLERLPDEVLDMEIVMRPMVQVTAHGPWGESIHWQPDIGQPRETWRVPGTTVDSPKPPTGGA